MSKALCGTKPVPRSTATCSLPDGHDDELCQGTTTRGYFKTWAAEVDVNGDRIKPRPWGRPRAIYRRPSDDEVEAGQVAVCSRCHETWPLSEFPQAKSKWCRSCINAAHRTQYTPDITRRQHLARHYDMTPEHFDQIMAEQDSKCAICRRSFTESQPRLDHDHDTGALRGILCPSCNTGLGNFSDSPELVQRAADYLKQPARWPKFGVPHEAPTGNR